MRDLCEAVFNCRIRIWFLAWALHACPWKRFVICCTSLLKLQGGPLRCGNWLRRKFWVLGPSEHQTLGIKAHWTPKSHFRRTSFSKLHLIVHGGGRTVNHSYALKYSKPCLNVGFYFCKNSDVQLRPLQLVLNWKEYWFLFCHSFDVKITMIVIRVHGVEQSEADAVHKITEIVFLWFMFCWCHSTVPAFCRRVWAVSEILILSLFADCIISKNALSLGNAAKMLLIQSLLLTWQTADVPFPFIIWSQWGYWVVPHMAWQLLSLHFQRSHH